MTENEFELCKQFFNDIEAFINVSIPQEDFITLVEYCEKTIANPVWIDKVDFPHSILGVFTVINSRTKIGNLLWLTPQLSLRCDNIITDLTGIFTEKAEAIKKELFCDPLFDIDKNKPPIEAADCFINAGYIPDIAEGFVNKIEKKLTKKAEANATSDDDKQVCRTKIESLRDLERKQDKYWYNTFSRKHPEDYKAINETIRSNITDPDLEEIVAFTARQIELLNDKDFLDGLNPFDALNIGDNHPVIVAINHFAEANVRLTMNNIDVYPHLGWYTAAKNYFTQVDDFVHEIRACNIVFNLEPRVVRGNILIELGNVHLEEEEVEFSFECEKPTPVGLGPPPALIACNKKALIQYQHFIDPLGAGQIKHLETKVLGQIDALFRTLMLQCPNPNTIVQELHTAATILDDSFQATNRALRTQPNVHLEPTCYEFPNELLPVKTQRKILYCRDGVAAHKIKQLPLGYCVVLCPYHKNNLEQEWRVRFKDPTFYKLYGAWVCEIHK